MARMFGTDGVRGVARRICPRRQASRHRRGRRGLHRVCPPAFAARALRARRLHDAPAQHRLRLVGGEKRRFLKKKGGGRALSLIFSEVTKKLIKYY